LDEFLERGVRLLRDCKNEAKLRLIDVKFPKEIRRNCPWCQKHTVHSVALYKRGKERAGSWGARRQAGRKRGYGGQKFPELIRKAKTTKKATLRLKCKECNREMMTKGIRLRRAEIAA
jgi:large subunit ribosomal protein L44e